jgi:hypothetical protein
MKQQDELPVSSACEQEMKTDRVGRAKIDCRALAHRRRTLARGPDREGKMGNLVPGNRGLGSGDENNAQPAAGNREQDCSSQ